MPGIGRKRLVASLVIVVALIVAAVATLVATDRFPGLGPAEPISTRTPDAGPVLHSDGGPKPPDGVWMGAWVKPDGAQTQAALFSAYKNYERTIGHRMSIVHLYHPWTNPFPKAAEKTFLNHGYQVLVSWGGTDTRAIAAGQYDDMIRQRAEAVKRLRKPILLMWRGEMDRPNLRAQIWSATDYVTAWRHIRKIFDQVGARNVGWVWCPLANGFDNGRAQPYYPGDNQVDWLCTDVYPDRDDAQPFSQVAAPFLKWARGHGKPIVIGEYGADAGNPRAQLAWVRGAWRTITSTPAIKAATYFDANVPDAHTPYQYSLRRNRAALTAFGQALGGPRVAQHVPERRKP